MKNHECFHEKSKHGTEEFPVAVYHSQGFIPYQWHYEYQFVYMKDGHGDFFINGKAVSLSAGDCAFCRGGQLHSMQQAHNQYFDFYAVLFNPSFLVGNTDICRKYILGDYILNPKFSSQKLKERKVVKIINQICRLFEDKSFGYELEIKMLFIQIYVTAFKYNLYNLAHDADAPHIPSLPNDLITVIAYIHAKFQEKITVQKLAGLIGYNDTYFSKYFKKYIGKAPMEYIHYYRLYKAAEILKNSNQAILEVSFECGYQNVNYFIKMFKREYGTTPKQFRNKPE